MGGDASGNVVALVDVFEPGAERTTTQLVRFDAAGARQWSLTLGPGLWGSRQLAVTPAGEVVLGACSAPSCFSNVDAPAVTASVMRISSEGRVLWTTPVPGSGFWSVDVDATGRTLVVVNAAAGPRILVLGDDGRIAFETATDIVGPRAAFGAEGGDFVVAGQDPATGRPVFERRTPDGGTRYRRTLDTRAGSVDRVDFAPNGSIALAGLFQEQLRWGEDVYSPAFSGAFLVVGGGDGSPQWSKSDPGLSPAGSAQPLLAFGRDNDVVAYTQTFGKGQGDVRSYTRDGELRWLHAVRGIFGTWLNAVAVASNGDVVVGGNGTGDEPFRRLTFDGGTHYVAVLAR